MDMAYIIILEGLLFIVLFGGLSWFRREGLSIQFAMEAITITVIFGLSALLLSLPVDPIVFLIVIYLITMRCRLLVDIGNYFGVRKNYIAADKSYRLAEVLFPDQANRLIIAVNQGTSMVLRGDLDGAIDKLKGVLSQAKEGYLGLKYESAAHYNLGVVYLKKKLEGMAVVEFNAVLDTWPASEYGRRAQNALKRIKKGGSEQTDNPVQ